MRTKQLTLFLLILSLATVLMVGCSQPTQGAGAPSAPSQEQEVEATEDIKVIASTSWTALMAEAAGVQNVTVLAPVELKHPPEYDFKPSDIQALESADWIIMAGYEPFMNKMIGANNISEEKILKVITTNTFENLKEQTRSIAEALGTQEQQQQWEAEFATALDGILAKAKEQEVSTTKVLVHTHMAAFIRSLGYDVIEVFGAEELSPAKIGELANLKPDLIVDNFHNPQGMTIAELAGVNRVELRNFPGPEHKNLLELFIDNAAKLGIE